MHLQLRDILKKYGDRAVLNGLSFDVEPGQVYGLLGPNGCGKSTALNLVAGLLKYDGGDILYDGGPLSRTTRMRIGFVPQEPALYPSLTCAEPLRFFGGIHGVPGKAIQARVDGAISAAGLEPYRDTRAHKLSGGWSQRLSLASSLVHEPELLLLDEPATGLDIEIRDHLWQLIDSIAARGASVLLASHGLQEAEAHCHRVGIFSKGVLAAEGSPDELCQKLGAEEVAEVQVEDPAELKRWAEARGWPVRERKDRQMLFLPRATTLAALAQELSGLSLRSLSLRAVTLEDAFLEIAGAAGNVEVE